MFITGIFDIDLVHDRKHFNDSFCRGHIVFSI